MGWENLNPIPTFIRLALLSTPINNNHFYTFTKEVVCTELHSTVNTHTV